jgi:hypothetical protein
MPCFVSQEDLEKERVSQCRWLLAVLFRVLPCGIVLVLSGF